MKKKPEQPPPSGEEHTEQLGPDDGVVASSGVRLVDFSKVARRDLWLVFDADDQVGSIARNPVTEKWRATVGVKQDESEVEIDFTSGIAARCFMLGFFRARAERVADAPSGFELVDSGHLDALWDAFKGLKNPLAIGDELTRAIERVVDGRPV